MRERNRNQKGHRYQRQQQPLFSPLIFLVMATIIDNINKDMQAITRQCIRNNMPEPRMIPAEICCDLSAIGYTWGWTKKTIAAGTEKQLIKSLNMKVCKKSEAAALMIAGEQTEGCFITGKSKRYWLKSKSEPAK
jgi:hypothetical protein